jgi:ATP-dependent DNA ligase
MQPPTGPNWFHEIKHDALQMMARRDTGVKLIIRNGKDLTDHFS